MLNERDRSGTNVSQLQWQWERASRAYGNYGNANQWTVNAGMASLARESAQNTSDARVDDQGELVYTFIRLTGAQRAEFEHAAHWAGLLEHLQAMAGNSDAAVTAGQIKAGVEALSQSDDLVLLQISDYGCRGLTGPEFRDVPASEYGNFIKLCRLDLFSGKDEAAGGSFGLGKAVYWRFSRLQTVLFNSQLRVEDNANGETQNRLFGVNAGVIHDLDGQSFQGRGYFGVAEGDDIASSWVDDGVATSLHVGRTDTRSGTTALLLGFYDPDDPVRGTSSAHELIETAKKLRQGLEESFWPLLARKRLTVRIRVRDNENLIHDELVDPEETYAELVSALNRFDAGEVAEDLDEPGSIIARDIPIQISARHDGSNNHDSFTHAAKLVVTLSDKQTDSLENSVCLVRRPEMVVQTLGREFEGRTYHAFLLAGASITPDDPSHEDLLADDFLRFAEPPAHDRWIPGTGRTQASQANLTGKYVPPWIPNLKAIEKRITDALYELFGTPPPAKGKTAESIMRNLRFLNAGPGSGGTGSTAGRGPQVNLTEWHVEDGRWVVTFELTAPNRPAGWSVTPALKFIGLDGRGQSVKWESLEPVTGATVEDGSARLPSQGRGRKVTATLRGTSVADLPIPAAEAAVDVVIARSGPGESEHRAGDKK